MELPKRKRGRYTCSHCKQSLAHTAYNHHEQLPHLYCPHFRTNVSSSSDTDSDSTFVCSQYEEQAISNQNINDDDDIQVDDVVDKEETSSCGSSSDSAPEVWEDSDSNHSDNELNSDENSLNAHTQLKYKVSIFLLLFHLCHHLSDRAMGHLLAFLSALFHYLSSCIVGAPLLKAFSDVFPKTLYSLRKAIKLNKKYVTYVVCPRCHTMYNEPECIVRTPSGEMSLKCNHIRYPNHPHRARRKQCGTQLMKTIKLGQSYKLVPKRTYVYYNIVESLQKLANKPGFLESCEKWRTRNVPSDTLADIFDGKLWKQMQDIDGVPFLSVPGNLALMLNIDWFQPFVLSQYSVGVIYLVVQNLPRTERFKAENIIIVSTIPGPREPSCDDLNPYLKCFVDDLLTLWNGVHLDLSTSVVGTRMIRAALLYVSSDIPATRKICGFYGLKAKFGCSKCLKCFPSMDFRSDYSGYDRKEWQPRDLNNHRLQVERSKVATSKAAKEKIEQESGVRYSELLRLPYFDIVRYHVVDPMHNLFLGTSKNL